MTNQFSRTRDKVQTTLNLQPRRAILGDWQGTVDDPYWQNSGNVQVRFLASGNTYGLPTLIRGPYQDPSIPLKPDHAVLVKIDSDGLPYVAASDWDTILAGGGRPVPAQPPLDGAYVRQDQIVTARCAQTVPPSLSIIISGWKARVAGVYYDFEGDPEFDLTPYLPASDHAVVGVFMANDYVTPVVYTGASVPLNDNLTIDDVNAVSLAAAVDETPLWFYDVASDAREITDDDTLFDGRGFLEAAGASAASTNYILIRDEKTQNTGGGTFSSGAWRTRTLNTIVTDTGGDASLGSNQITLDTGSYRARIACPAYAVNHHQARLYNVTDSAVLLLGSSAWATSTLTVATVFIPGVQNHSLIEGRFTLASAKTLEVQHQCDNTQTGNGFGEAANFTTEVYTIVELIRE